MTRRVMIDVGRLQFNDLIALKKGAQIWECEYGKELQAELLEDPRVFTNKDGIRRVEFCAKRVGSEGPDIDYVSSENYNYPHLYNQRQIYTLEELEQEAEAYRREQQKNLG